MVVSLGNDVGNSYLQIDIYRYNGAGEELVYTGVVANMIGAYTLNMSAFAWDGWATRTPADGIKVRFWNKGLTTQTLVCTLNTDSRLMFEL
jgi:hypothetical protein